MKTKIILGAATLLLAAIPNLFAQDLARNPAADSVLLAYDQPHAAAALADADNAGGTAADAKDEEAELAKKLNNPVANLISVPVQNNWDFGIGPANAMKYTANIQPVVPLSISDDWNLIIRTILPVIYAESPVNGGSSHSGLGDTTQSFFFSPKEPVGG